MIRKYTIAVDAYPSEFPDVIVEASSQREAYDKAWRTFDAEKRDKVITLDIVDVEESNTFDRRLRVRTPGQFKHIWDVAFTAMRKLEEQNALRTNAGQETKQ